jgi:hypothetical protein
MTNAPSNAASSINGAPILNTYQKLFTNDAAVERKACPHVSDGEIEMGQDGATGWVCLAPIIGATAKIKSATVAIFRATTGRGKSAKAIASTMTFKLGELNIAASTDSVLMPEAYSPRATGATQLAHTPKGAPVAAPISAFR